MDLLIWIVLAVTFALTLLVVLYFQRSGNKNESEKKEKTGAARAAATGGQGAVMAGGMRRSRNIRSRLAAVQRARGQGEVMPKEDGEDDEGENPEADEEKIPTGKIGTKKLKRIQEKAEKKAQREQEEALREDRKKREALREKERQQEFEAEQEHKKKEEEEAARQREEQEKHEHEEYLALKQGFIIEDEGEGAAEEQEGHSIQDFIEHIRKNKIVYLEELAAEFGLKTQEAIDRIHSLQENGELTGVIDDRGKFIFISQEELEAVATFIKQRGRVSIGDLVTSSNTLINLQPETEAVTS